MTPSIIGGMILCNDHIDEAVRQENADSCRTAVILSLGISHRCRSVLDLAVHAGIAAWPMDRYKCYV